jgi:hypothetical protein
VFLIRTRTREDMGWCSTRTTCAIREAAIAQPGQVEDQGAQVEVLNEGTTNTQAARGKIDGVVIKGGGEMITTANDGSDAQ